MTKKLPKNSDYSPGENYSNTPVPGECVYSGIQAPIFDGKALVYDSIPIQYFYKDKSLEVLERDFALKFPGPYKTFIEEQNRRLLDFIETYTKNHEENG